MKRSRESSKVVLVPYPAQGHVTPMLQLASALRDRGFEPVLVTPEFVHCRIVSQIEPEDGIDLMSIPDGLAENEVRDFFTIGFAMENNMPVHLERIICSFDHSGGVALIVVDLLASWAIDVANRCKIPAVGFWPAMLATYNLIAAIPDMIRLGLISGSGSPQHQGSICFLPGQPMLCTEDLPWLVGNSAARKSRFKFWITTVDRTRALRWILVNSFLDECGEYDQHKPIQQSSHNPRVFQVGPLSMHTRSKKNPSFWEEDPSCLDWLNKQKPCSVIYVSFGSWVGPIGEEKIAELALGLEAAGSPFIWVLGHMWRKELPNGYLERMVGQGKVVSWAPQKEVLRHAAIGCYLTHCGWNSTLEAIECGKRLLCYPIAGDQFVNCTYIVKVWGIGLKMNGIGRGDVEEGVRRVMEEGDEGEMNQKVMELKERVMGEEGCSIAVDCLTTFIDDLKKSNHHDL